MRVYLAARYGRRAEMAGYAELLRELGHTVTSRWVDGDHGVPDDGLSERADPAVRKRAALEDYEDLLDAQVCICFTEPAGAFARGGRHVEYGIALANQLILVVVGPAENIFYELADGRVETFEEALVVLANWGAPPSCRVCGCTDDRACEGGCWWVEADLCSACAETMGEDADGRG